MIEIDTRLRVARGIAKSESQASVQVFRTLKRRGHRPFPPPFVSDGHGGIDEALITVYGKVPAYSGWGRPPRKKQAVDGWQYMQLVKQRDAYRRVTGLAAKVMHGTAAQVKKQLPMHLSYGERTHLTMRVFNSRLVRTGLAFSKSLAMHRAAAAWDDLYYNWVHTVKTLRVPAIEPGIKKWEPCTPAMAAGLTMQPWTPKDLLSWVIPPNVKQHSKG